jgi:hypothetical protein
MKKLLLLPLIILGLSVDAATPTANAGPDQTIYLTQTSAVTLSGSGTSTAISYFWTEVSSDYGSGANITSPSSATTTVTGFPQGVFYFKLTVTDNSGAKATDIVTISVDYTAPPSGATIVNHPVFADMAPIVNYRSNNTPSIWANFWSDFRHIAGNSPNQFYLYRDVEEGMSIDNQYAKLYTTIIDGVPGGTGDFGRSEIGIAGWRVVPNVTYMYEWKGYFPQDLSTLITNPKQEATIIWQLHGNDGNSPPIELDILKNQLTLQENVHNGNCANATPAMTTNPWVPIYPITNMYNQTHTIRITVREGLAGSGAFVKIEIDGVQKYFRNSGQVGQTLGMDYPKAGTLYDYGQIMVSPENHTRGRKVSLVTEKYICYQLNGNQAPVANAGLDKTITLPINSVTLTGSGTSTNGSISSYSWTKISGPSAGAITNASNASTTVTGLVQGVYKFELTVTDNNGATATSTLQVTVSAAANTAPVANAGLDKTITLPSNSATLTGSGTEANGTITSYSWTKISGPSGGTISNGANALTPVTGLVQGVYKFALVVTDNNGATGSDTMQVTVNAAANIAPVANAGADKTITLPTNGVTLTGSGTDANGTITNFFWTKISGPSAGAITNASNASTPVTGLVQGVYKFEIVVTDNNGATGSDTMQVTVNAVANIAPVANAGADKTITLPTNSVTLGGSGTDANGTITSYNWTKISGPSAGAITNAGNASTPVSGMIQGVYKFELVVTDNNGAIGRDTMQLTVIAASNIAPVANAGLDQTITSPTSIATLTGSGTDADGTVVGYFWKQISGPSTSGLASPNLAETISDNLVAGTYEFELTVTDNMGAVGKDSIVIVVAAPRLNLLNPDLLSNSMKIYPNPVVDKATLEINLTQAKSKVMVVITNMLGNIVYQKNLPAGQTNIKEIINMQNLSKGTYAVTVYFSDVEKQTIKIIRL